MKNKILIIALLIITVLIIGHVKSAKATVYLWDDSSSGAYPYGYTFSNNNNCTQGQNFVATSGNLYGVLINVTSNTTANIGSQFAFCINGTVSNWITYHGPDTYFVDFATPLSISSGNPWFGWEGQNITSGYFEVQNWNTLRNYGIGYGGPLINETVSSTFVMDGTKQNSTFSMESDLSKWWYLTASGVNTSTTYRAKVEWWPHLNTSTITTDWSGYWTPASTTQNVAVGISEKLLLPIEQYPKQIDWKAYLEKDGNIVATSNENSFWIVPTAVIAQDVIAKAADASSTPAYWSCAVNLFGFDTLDLCHWAFVAVVPDDSVVKKFQNISFLDKIPLSYVYDIKGIFENPTSTKEGTPSLSIELPTELAHASTSIEILSSSTINFVGVERINFFRNLAGLMFWAIGLYYVYTEIADFGKSNEENA